MKSQTLKSQYATSIELYPFRTEAGNIDLFYKVEVLLTVEDGISLNPGPRNIVVNTPQLRDASQAAALYDAVAIATRIVVAWEAEGQFSDLDLEPVTAEDRAAWAEEKAAVSVARDNARRAAEVKAAAEREAKEAAERERVQKEEAKARKALLAAGLLPSAGDRDRFIDKARELTVELSWDRDFARRRTSLRLLVRRQGTGWGTRPRRIGLEDLTAKLDKLATDL